MKSILEMDDIEIRQYYRDLEKQHIQHIIEIERKFITNKDPFFRYKKRSRVVKYGEYKSEFTNILDTNWPTGNFWDAY